MRPKSDKYRCLRAYLIQFNALDTKLIVPRRIGISDATLTATKLSKIKPSKTETAQSGKVNSVS